MTPRSTRPQQAMMQRPEGGYGPSMSGGGTGEEHMPAMYGAVAGPQSMAAASGGGLPLGMGGPMSGQSGAQTALAGMQQQMPQQALQSMQGQMPQPPWVPPSNTSAAGGRGGFQTGGPDPYVPQGRPQVPGMALHGDPSGAMGYGTPGGMNLHGDPMGSMGRGQLLARALRGR